MRIFIAIVIAMSLATGSALALDENKQNKWLLSVTANYGSWTASGQDSNGTQALSLTQLSYDTQNWGMAITGSYASTSYTPQDSDTSFDLNTFGDTDISTYYGFTTNSLLIRGGVDVRMPTGKSSYTEDEYSLLITDDVIEDLMLVNSYGGGLNVSPHLLLAKQFEKLTIGFGMKYEIKGEYDPTSDLDSDNLDPGDWFFAMLNGVYKLSDSDYWMVTFSYSRYGEDSQAGEDIFRQGDTFAMELRLITKWWEDLTTMSGVSYQSQESNEVLSGESILASEASNSNNNKLELYLYNIYRYSNNFSITGLVGVKMVGSNGYNVDDPFYDAGRDKYYVEPGVIWHLNRQSYITAKLRYASIEDSADAWSAEDTTFTAINFDAGVVYSF